MHWIFVNPLINYCMPKAANEKTVRLCYGLTNSAIHVREKQIVSAGRRVATLSLTQYLTAGGY